MNWNNAYIEMKDNGAFVRRASWGSKYCIWLKPAVNIKLDWCRDPQLKKIIEKYGHQSDDTRVIKANDCICLFNGISVETGFQLRREDRVAEDWMIVNI